MLAERHRLENLYLTALDYLVRFHGAGGDVEPVARYGELALELEPLREDVHRHLMDAYGAAGRDDLVERQFERCRHGLLDELGADPMPETTAVYSRSPAGPAPAPDRTVAALLAELERAGAMSPGSARASSGPSTAAAPAHLTAWDRRDRSAIAW